MFLQLCLEYHLDSLSPLPPHTQRSKPRPPSHLKWPVAAPLAERDCGLRSPSSRHPHPTFWAASHNCFSLAAAAFSVLSPSAGHQPVQRRQTLCIPLLQLKERKGETNGHQQITQGQWRKDRAGLSPSGSAHPWGDSACPLPQGGVSTTNSSHTHTHTPPVGMNGLELRVERRHRAGCVPTEELFN